MEIKPLMNEDEESKLTFSSVFNIYTDGGYRRDKDVGGWAYAIVYKKDIVAEGFGVESSGATNNIMELTGAIKGMEAFIKEFMPKHENYLVNIICDSTYVLGGIKLRWIEKWKRNNWFRFGTKQPVKNKELWEEIDRLNSIIKNTKWIWVRGHSGNKYNEYVDEAINREIDRYLKNNKK